MRVWHVFAVLSVLTLAVHVDAAKKPYILEHIKPKAQKKVVHGNTSLYFVTNSKDLME